MASAGRLLEPPQGDRNGDAANLLLACRLIVVAFVVNGQVRRLPGHFLPLFSERDRVGSQAAFGHGIQVASLGAAVALVLNQAPPLAATVAGAAILLGTISSRLYFENNTEYTGLILLLACLAASGDRTRLVRYQVVPLYAAAALNKTLDADWRSGQFVESWPAVTSLHATYHHLSSLLRRRPWRPASRSGDSPLRDLDGGGYHSTLMVTAGGAFGMFYFSLLASYLALRGPGRRACGRTRDRSGNRPGGRRPPAHRRPARPADAADPLRSSRAPAGKHIAWAYCHVPNGSTVDMTGRIERQIEPSAPGAADLVRARAAGRPPTSSPTTRTTSAGTSAGASPIWPACSRGRFRSPTPIARPTPGYSCARARRRRARASTGCAATTPPARPCGGRCAKTAGTRRRDTASPPRAAPAGPRRPGAGGARAPGPPSRPEAPGGAAARTARTRPTCRNV
jgi:hypothetical protein